MTKFVFVAKDNSGKIVESFNVIGAEIKSKEYKRKCGYSDSDKIFYVKKANKYGIKWICQEYSRCLGDHIINFSSNQRIPFSNYKIIAV